MAKVIHVEALGGPELLSIADVPVREPRPGEVRFKVEAFALNRADILYITGEHYTQLKLPSRVGSEAAGVVDAVGEGVTRFRVGDRVSSVPFYTKESDWHGVQGEYAIVPEGFIAPWPEGFSAVEACSVWMQYLTAYYALVSVGQLGPGKTVLITAAASSAGIGAIQTAQAVGARVIATTRSACKVQFLEELGAHHVIVTRSDEDLAPLLRDYTGGKGVDLVFDPIGGDFLKNYAGGLNWEGKILIYGSLNSLQTSLPLLPTIRSKASIHPYSMFNHTCFPGELQEGIAFVMKQIGTGAFRPVIDRVFNFEDTVAAYQHMQGNSQRGKIVVSVAEPANSHLSG